MSSRLEALCENLLEAGCLELCKWSSIRKAAQSKLFCKQGDRKISSHENVWKLRKNVIFICRKGLFGLTMLHFAPLYSLWQHVTQRCDTMYFDAASNLSKNWTFVKFEPSKIAPTRSLQKATEPRMPRHVDTSWKTRQHNCDHCDPWTSRTPFTLSRDVQSRVARAWGPHRVGGEDICFY